jgi:putative ABC transport system permease protein
MRALDLPRLAWRYLWASPLTAGLNLLLLSLGLSAITLVLLVSEQLEQGLQRDLAGIDLVVGAKGSPMQIMLAGVFHLDTPTGNIPLATLDDLRRHPLVKQAVPLSLGDALKGFRIVGTTPEYLALYGAGLRQGRVWQAPMQAVLGAEVAQRLGLRPGSRFAGNHGLGEGGEAHAGHDYEVVGVLEATGGVLDRLVLVDLVSVWEVHEAHHGGAHNDDDREITLALVSYRSPLAAISLPRWVNAQPGLQAAAPALETARLMRMVGAGTEVLQGFGWVMLVSAGLSVWVALLHAVRARQADLAMLRMLGAPAWRVAWLIAIEALLLAGAASVIGLLAGHGWVELLGRVLAQRQSVHLSGAWWSVHEWAVPGMAFALALLAAAWPAWRAYRLDVTTLLQAPR